MNRQSTVSVIIPCYNGHTFIDQTIDSIRNQSTKALEIIVIDDGSTNPETINHLDQLPDDVKLVRQKNLGLPGARNTGFREARGEFVLPLDCDDWLAPDFLERGLKLLNEQDDVSFVFSWLKLEAESDGVLAKEYNGFEQLFLNQLPYCLLQPKHLWEKLGGYDENMRLGYEDWEWNIRLTKHGYYGKAIPASLFHYRVQSTGMLASTSRARHADLWHHIRCLHPDMFSLSHLFQSWKRWKNTPSTRPLWLYFGWELLYRLLPRRLFNKLIGLIFNWSDSAKFRKS